MTHKEVCVHTEWNICAQKTKHSSSMSTCCIYINDFFDQVIAKLTDELLYGGSMVMGGWFFAVLAHSTFSEKTSNLAG